MGRFEDRCCALYTIQGRCFPLSGQLAATIFDIVRSAIERERGPMLRHVAMFKWKDGVQDEKKVAT
jgi:hypothetical protein